MYLSQNIKPVKTTMGDEKIKCRKGGMDILKGILKRQDILSFQSWSSAMWALNFRLPLIFMPTLLLQKHFPYLQIYRFSPYNSSVQNYRYITKCYVKSCLLLYPITNINPEIRVYL